DVNNLGTGAHGPSNPEVLYTPDGVTRELEGLETVKAERVTRPVEIDGGTVEAGDTPGAARKRTSEGPGQSGTPAANSGLREAEAAPTRLRRVRRARTGSAG